MANRREAATRCEAQRIRAVRCLEPASRRRCPTILAAVSDIQIFDIIEDFTPGNTLFRADLMGAAFAEGGLNHPVIQAFTSDDINAAQQFFINDPGRIYLSELQQSDVPIFVMNSWDDSNHLVNLNADSFLTLKPGVPRRHFLTTGGHASASNDIEDLLNYESIVRWMERFLKGVPNGIDQEPFAEVAVIPHAPKDYQDPKTEWIHRSAGRLAAAEPRHDLLSTRQRPSPSERAEQRGERGPGSQPRRAGLWAAAVRPGRRQARQDAAADPAAAEHVSIPRPLPKTWSSSVAPSSKWT
jgi:predicted acyl esterase